MVTWVETFEPEITKLEVKIYLRNPYEKDTESILKEKERKENEK